MSDQPSTFIDLSLAGQARPSEIDDFVDVWHRGDGRVELHEFLGMTSEEYALWVSNPDALSAILNARREKLRVRA
jgi:hypothetical protein